MLPTPPVRRAVMSPSCFAHSCHRPTRGGCYRCLRGVARPCLRIHAGIREFCGVPCPLAMDRVDSHTGLTVLGRPVCVSQGQRPEGADTGGIRGVGDPATEPLMSVVIVALLLVAGAAIGLAMGALGFLLTRSGGLDCAYSWLRLPRSRPSSLCNREALITKYRADPVVIRSPSSRVCTIESPNGGKTSIILPPVIKKASDSHPTPLTKDIPVPSPLLGPHHLPVVEPLDLSRAPVFPAMAGFLGVAPVLGGFRGCCPGWLRISPFPHRRRGLPAATHRGLYAPCPAVRR